MRRRRTRRTVAAMLRLLPLSLLLVLFVTASAQAATVKVPVPPEGQIAVAVASVSKQASLKAAAPAGIAVTGGAKRGRLAVAVLHRRGVTAAGVVTVKVKGRAKGLRTVGSALAGATVPATTCKRLSALLSKPLRSGGIAAADLRAVGGAAAARLCGKPLPAGASAVLDRLGLGTAPPGGGGISAPGAIRPAASPGGGGTPTNQCSNGIDDDGDGQVDAPSERRPRPDPGCMNANDSTESGEVPLACNAGAGVGDDRSVLQIGINDGCGEFVDVAVYAAPNAFVCDIAASAGNWVCVIAHGHAFAETRNAVGAEMADLQIGLNGDVDCAVPATIVLTRRTLEVAELVTPIARCGEPEPACSNGADDDGDGMADARETGSDPDPGCTSAADTSEDSEIDLPDGCTVGGGSVGGDALFPAVEVSGCGSVTGLWFKPSATPADCVYAIGDAGGQPCAVTGASVGASFPATTAVVALGTHTTAAPQCAPVTVAITLADGRVAALRDDWC
jgi:hypothetical protein